MVNNFLLAPAADKIHHCHINKNIEARHELAGVKLIIFNF